MRTLHGGHTSGMQSKVHPTYRLSYHVTNWLAYNRALVRRGDVAMCVALGDCHLNTSQERLTGTGSDGTVCDGPGAPDQDGEHVSLRLAVGRLIPDAHVSAVA